ncbi:MAG: HEAT repeat domain-containing protein [Phycisphaerae bacterium]
MLLLAWLSLVGAGACRFGAAQPGRISSPDPLERAKAIVRAGKSRDVSAIPLLVDRLEDENEAVRFYAIQALVRITGRDFGYRYYSPAAERRRAIRRWRDFVDRRGSGRDAAHASN